MALAWEMVCQEFDFDGSWRDIYVLETTMADWQRMLDSLQTSPYEVRYFRNDNPTDLPKEAAQAFPLPDECDRLLSVTFSGIQANCHFFTEQQIEFDIDPREVKGQVELDALFGFMRRVADAVNKEVVLTPENFQGCVIFKIRPGEDRVEYSSL